MTDFNIIQALALNDVRVLVEKGKSYGDSWKRRGGVGAFMMLARKWDRIENLSTYEAYNIFAAAHDGGEEGILDDIADLRRYLLLVEEEVRAGRVGLGQVGGTARADDSRANSVGGDHVRDGLSYATVGADGQDRAYANRRDELKDRTGVTQTGHEMRHSPISAHQWPEIEHGGNSLKTGEITKTASDGWVSVDSV